MEGGIQKQLAAKREKAALLERKLELQQGLPFLYGWKWYPWAREFFESTNKMNFLCAANQISKSSTQIRKCIDWATNREKWVKLWPMKPIQFWYLYPTKDVAEIEFETKWKLFLPRGKYADDPTYGWKEEWKNKSLFAIHFNSGVHVYFKTYAQDAQHLQSGTCDAIFCDEELPVELYDELIMRITASDGYFHMVFTATLGQDFWKEVIEEKGDKERLKEAFKLQVAMFDCLKYEDGSPSHWTPAKIQQAISRCKSQAEVLRRVYGRFIVDAGRKYECFDRIQNMKKKSHPHEYPHGWHVYAGVDIGSGGEKGHPASIVFVAVRPDFRAGRVFKAWRGDGIVTESSDILRQFRKMKGKIICTGQYYDWGSKDFQIVATRNSEPFLKAEKGHDIGEDTINVLFKNRMLYLYEGDPEMEKLSSELATLKTETPKNKAKDDLVDALRYAVSQIPWDWSVITSQPAPGKVKPTPEQTELEQRKAAFMGGEEEDKTWDVEEEMEAWGELYEA